MKSCLSKSARQATSIPDHVVPVYREYIDGGTSSQKDLSKDFANDFTQSDDTLTATQFLVTSLQQALSAAPPFLPGQDNTEVTIEKIIPEAINLWC